MEIKQRALLMILDGWGIGKGDHTDAIYHANTPFMDSLLNTKPHHTLRTYGSNVGLPEGQMGNSEVGHLNIGAGRVVYQMLARINKAFRENEVEQMEMLQNLIAEAKSNSSSIHLLGLISDGGIHSHQKHMLGLCEILKQHGLDKRTYVHGFLDGRDTDPNSGKGFIADALNSSQLGDCKLTSLIGRYYAMDRDKRWERVQKSYELMTSSIGEHATDILASIQSNYENGVTDEFMEPIWNDQVGDEGRIKEGDTVLFFNFRTDRGRELTEVLSQRSIEGTNMKPLNLNYYTMTEYSKDFKGIQVLFENEDLKMTMGEYLSTSGKTQIRAAETEKYPHVTFFFSGGREDKFEGEDRVLIQSPKVATYDLQPEMSAIPLKDALIDRINNNPTDFICVNFANADMVGHTGVFTAMQKACEAVDGCVKEMVEAATQQGYKILIIADHGNADNAINADGSPNTAHSVNPVPCILLNCGNQDVKEGVLADVAPTLLKMMGMNQPTEMTGQALY
jgi:2,3-bisphosphoglycerate-independent phosphoglycerate mutase